MTTKSAVTNCSCVLVPDTSKVISFVPRLNAMSTLLTLMVDVPLLQLEKPLVFKMSPASTDGRMARAARAAPDVLHMSVLCTGCLLMDRWVAVEPPGSIG